MKVGPPSTYHPVRRFMSSSIIFPLIGLVVIGITAYPLVKKVQQKRMIDAEIRQLQQESQRVEGKNKQLQETLDYLKSGQFIEAQARLNLDLKKPGEKVVVIKDENQAATTTVATIFDVPGLDKTATVKKVSNPRKWVEYFFNRPTP